MVLMVLTILFGVTIALFCVMSVQSTDIQVVTRYTAFGNVHFYKGVWWQLYSFAVFATVVSIAHTAIMVRLHNLGRRDFGLVFGWTAWVILMITIFYMNEILNLAFI